MKSIRIMHLNDPIQIGIGGAEKSTLTLLRGMKDTTFDLIVASFVRYREPQGEFIEEAKKLGIAARIITTKKKCRFMLSELFRNLFNLCHLLRKENIKLLHTHGYKTDIIGLLAAKILNIPIVSTAHGWTACSRNVKLYEFLDSLALRFFDRVIAVSDGMKDRLLESHIPPKKIVMIHNAIELKASTGTPALAGVGLLLTKPFKDSFNLNNDNKLIGAIGRLSIEKGFGYFLEAGKEVISRYPQARLLVVGEGPERQNLEILAERLAIKDKTIFCGFQKDISKIYSILDVVVLSSLTEGLPQTLLEALVHEKPVVATRVGGVPELIKDGETGILVDPKDSLKLANGILKILNNPEEAKNLAIRGRKLVNEKFNSKSMCEKLGKLYYEVLK
ncbi:MAG TPA: glycosyltransferase [Candidatus Brocadiia bacterium]|nr:glycosyltransferase [Candidatus Brocadiales bacterium]